MQNSVSERPLSTVLGTPTTRIPCSWSHCAPLSVAFPPVRTPIRMLSPRGYLPLTARAPFLSLERLVELLGGDRAHERQDLAQPARPAIGLQGVLHREGFSQLIVREDPFLDQVLPEAL